jgi:integral membrane sensor domain MASE1
LVIAGGVLIYVLLLPMILGNLVGLPFVVKLCLSAVLIVPMGFLMGMPFPTGLRALAEAGDRRAEWAWALNGGATVLGSVSAMIIAIHLGLNVTLACGALAYVLAAAWRVRPEVKHEAAAS